MLRKPQTFAREALNVVISRRLFQNVGQWDPSVFEYLCYRALTTDAYQYYAIRVVRQSVGWICSQQSMKCSDSIQHRVCAAACIGDLGLIQSLLLNGANVNAKSDIFGSLPLHAAREGHTPPVIQFLLESGVDPECDTLRWTTESERNDVQRFIFPRTDKEPWTPLGAVAFTGHGAIIKLLLEPRYSLSRSSCSFFRAIIHASRGHVDILEMLITIADFDAITQKVKTRVLDSALKASASRSHLESMQLLLESGAPVDLSIPQEIEHTALWYAACHSRNEAIELLLDRGADIDEGFMWPDAPLAIAGRMGFPGTVALLADRGAEVTNGRVYAFDQIGIISPYCVIKVLLEKEVLKRDEDGAMRMLNEEHRANRQDLIDLLF